jgi:hypothetical protein
VVTVDPFGPFKAAGDWILAARRTVRNRKAQQGAEMLYSAGVIVIAMRMIRDRMNELLSPLRNFNPKDWHAERRRGCIEGLRSFAVDPSHPFDMLDQHWASLRSYSYDEELPPKIRELAGEIALRAVNIIHVGEDPMGELYEEPMGEEEFAERVTGQAWTEGLQRYADRARREFGDVSTDLRAGDTLILGFLPTLLWLIDNAEDEPEVVALRVLANGLLVTRSREGDTDINKITAEAGRTFGKLRYEIVHLYPEVPELNWANPKEG